MFKTLDWKTHSFEPNLNIPGCIDHCIATYLGALAFYPPEGSEELANFESFDTSLLHQPEHRPLQLHLVSCSGVGGYWVHDLMSNRMYFMGLEEEGYDVCSDPTTKNILCLTTHHPGLYAKFCPSYDGRCTAEEKAEMVKKCYGLMEAGIEEKVSVAPTWEITEWILRESGWSEDIITFALSGY